jgi:putative ABC transport system substrate-binding protein
MRRREFISLLSGAVTAWPLAARAQQAMPVISFLAGGVASASEAAVAGFRQGLRQTSYVEDQNLHIAFRWAEGRYERFPQLAAELVSNVSAITAIGAPAALAAVAATKTIPIAFISSVDPVKVGLVASFSRPGGNATGVAFLESELVGKQFEVLRDLVPKATLMGFLVNPKSANAETQLSAVTVANQALGLEIAVQNASTERDLETAFAAFAQRRVAALVVGSDPFFYGKRALLAALAAQHALPAAHETAGGHVFAIIIDSTPTVRPASLPAGFSKRCSASKCRCRCSCA